MISNAKTNYFSKSARHRKIAKDLKKQNIAELFNNPWLTPMAVLIKKNGQLVSTWSTENSLTIQIDNDGI